MIEQTIELRALIASLERGDTPLVLGFAADGRPIANDRLLNVATRLAIVEAATGSGGEGPELAQKINEAIAKADLVTNVVSPSALYFGNKPILYDVNGVYGAPLMIYVNRQYFSRTLEGAVALTIGTESARIPGFTELQVPGAGFAYKVIINRLTGVLSAVPSGAMPALSDDDFYLFEVKGSIVSKEQYPVVLVEGGKGSFYPYQPFVVEQGNRVLIPRIRAENELYSALRPMPALLFEKEIVLAPGTTPEMIYFDYIAEEAGQDPWKVAQHPRWPDSPATVPVISSEGPGSPFCCHIGVPLIGAVPNGSVDNVANLGKNEVEKALYPNGTAEPCNILAPSLIGMGFTRGMNDPTRSRPYYGPAIPDLYPGQTRPIRLLVQTDISDDWPLIRAYALNDKLTDLHHVTLVMEERFSARAASFFGWLTIPIDSDRGPYVGIRAGTIADDGRDIRLCGLQVGAASGAKLWMFRDAYPPYNERGIGTGGGLNDAQRRLLGTTAGLDIIYPSELNLIQGREQILYTSGMLANRTDGQDVQLTIEPANGLLDSRPLPRSDKVELVVRGGDLLPESNILLRTFTQTSRDLRGERPIRVRTADRAALQDKVVACHFLGSSTTQFVGFQHAARREMLVCGATMNFYGTVDQTDQSSSDVILKGEGRGGRTATHFTYEAGTTGTYSAPFPDSFIPQYLALSSNDKIPYNPYLRAAKAGDPPEKVFFGYIFDFAFYWKRFNDYFAANGMPLWPNPQFVGVGVGANDISAYGLPAGSPGVERALAIITDSIRTAFPLCHVLLIVTTLPITNTTDAKWPQVVELYRLHAAAVEARKAQLDPQGRSYVTLVSGPAHQSPFSGWFTDDLAIDAVTGSIRSEISDKAHCRVVAKEQLGIAVASTIANRVVGEYTYTPPTPASVVAGAVADVARLKRIAAPNIVSFGAGKSILFDFLGTHGLPRTFYVPRAVTIRTLAGGGDVPFTVGTDSTRLPGYTELVAPNPALLYKAFINRLTGQLTISVASDALTLSEDLIPLFDTTGDVAFNARVPILRVDEEDGFLHLYNPIVEEAGHLLLIPRMRCLTSAYTTVRPVPMSAWGREVMYEKEIAIANGGTPQTLVLDHVAAAKGLDPLVQVTLPRQAGGPTMTRIASGAQAASPLAHHTGSPVMGVTNGGSVRNVANLGQNGVELATIKGGTLAYTDFSEPALIAAGYTRAATSAAKVSAFYGVPLDDIRVAETRFIRLAVELDYDTTIDNTDPVFFAGYIDSLNLARHSVTLKIERQLSARALILIAQFTLPATTTYSGWKGIWVGCSAFGGKAIKFGGLQIGQGARRATYVLRDDFPAPVVVTVPRKIIYPKEMFLVEGQRQMLYADGLLPIRNDNQETTVTLVPKVLFSNAMMMPTDFRDETLLVGGQVPSKVSIVVRNKLSPDSGARGELPVNVRTAALANVSGKAILALISGDSVSDYAGWPFACRRELMRLGATFSTIGTLELQENDDITGVEIRMPGEARAGKKSSNFTYEFDPGNDVVCEPFPDSFIASYLALSEGNRRNYNPYLRLAIAGDPSEFVHQGYIIDFAFYLKRFNDYYTSIGRPEKVMGVPDANVLVIGSNDYLHGTFPARSGFVTHAHDAWAARSLAAWPNTRVLFMVNPLGRNIAGDGDFAAAQTLAGLIAGSVYRFRDAKDVRGNPMVSWVSALAHCSSMNGYRSTYGTTDVVTGYMESTLLDPVHVEGFVKEQQGIMMAHVLACHAAGA